jgi:outer membrane protein assembly factor BamB
MVFISSGYDDPVLYAIRADGSGDVTNTHVAWTLHRGAPHNPSPVLVGDELYVVSDRGIVVCLDAVTGAEHWRERLAGTFSASPLYGEGRIYFTDEDGLTTVIAARREFEVLAANQIAGRTLASLAVSGKALFMRSDTHLYKIADSTGAP